MNSEYQHQRPPALIQIYTVFLKILISNSNNEFLFIFFDAFRFIFLVPFLYNFPLSKPIVLIFSFFIFFFSFSKFSATEKGKLE